MRRFLVDLFRILLSVRISSQICWLIKTQTWYKPQWNRASQDNFMTLDVLSGISSVRMFWDRLTVLPWRKVHYKCVGFAARYCRSSGTTISLLGMCSAKSQMFELDSNIIAIGLVLGINVWHYSWEIVWCQFEYHTISVLHWAIGTQRLSFIR